MVAKGRRQLSDGSSSLVFVWNFQTLAARDTPDHGVKKQSKKKKKKHIMVSVKAKAKIQQFPETHQKTWWTLLIAILVTLPRTLLIFKHRPDWKNDVCNGNEYFFSWIFRLTHRSFWPFLAHEPPIPIFLAG